MIDEAKVTINNVELTPAQSMTLRVAVTNFIWSLQEEDAFGNDQHGKEMGRLYKVHCDAILKLMIEGA